MHSETLAPWRHSHRFDAGNEAGRRGTAIVAWITVAMMIVEIVAGLAANSMALLADGFHMSSHAVAIGLSSFAYAAARRWADDPRFAFGTWKIEILGGFASAVFLLVVAAAMVYGSVDRLLSPAPIHFEEALVIASLGLVVNLACARILGAAHHQHAHAGHGHDHAHADQDHGHDLNLRSAYVHVIADAATSVLAILALLGGWIYGWSWLDPVMGLVGAAVVAWWARGLILDSSAILLDREMHHPVVDEIRDAIEAGGRGGDARVADLHVWRVGRAAYACAVTVVTHDRTLTPESVRSWMSTHEEVVHSTIEVHCCPN
jgi:cation diffusion facilitator family transporter